jgi:hypothetical protein
MDLATIILSIAVTVAIVLIALAIWLPLSRYIWREIVKLSRSEPSNSSAEQQKDIAPSQPKRTDHRNGAEP